jgi:hypothetical protein
MAVGNSILLIRCARTWAKGRSTRRLLLRNLAAYGFFALIHLLFFVRTQEARYSHHIFPLLLAGTALGWTELLERTERRVRKLVLLSLFLSLPWFKEVPVQGFNSPEHASATLADGEALARIFPRTTRILSDCYVYIPPFIPAVQDSLGIRNEEIRRFKPDVLVFSRRMTGRWVWPEPGTSFEEGRWQTADKCNAPCRDSINLFSELRREGSPFRHHFTSERLIVLERK